MSRNEQRHTNPDQRSPGQRTRVFMMDLWATVPYYTAYLSRALLQQGFDVQVGSITYYLDRDCFRSRNLPLDPGRMDVVGRLDLPKTMRRVLKLAEGMLNLVALCVRFLFRPPAIVHVQYLPLLRSRFPVDSWFIHWCQRRGSKIVLTVHDLMPHDTDEQHKQIYLRLYHRADALICHSGHIRARLETEFGIAPEKISVIPHGPFFYDLPEGDAHATRQSFGIAEAQPIVLWQGIIFPYKGIDLLLNAWQHVEPASNAMLVVVGTGAPDLLEQLRAQVSELGLQRVQFHFRFTSTQELVAIYRAADVVVYPYRAITTSGALATGLALKRVIVASDLPVFRELLTHGQDALLVDPGDAAALASALLSALNDPQLRNRLSSAVLARDFGPGSWKQIAERTGELYDALL